MINLEQKIYTIDGIEADEVTDIKTIDAYGCEKTEKRVVKLILRSALCNALLRDSLRPSVELIKDRYNLYNKVKNATQIEFNEEELNLLEEAIIEKYPVFYAGQILSLIK